MKIADVFAGLGCFSLALKKVRTDAELVWACEIEPGLNSLYERNHGLKPETDITKIALNEVPDFDLLTGGFPCQPFSIMNARGKKGLEHEKGDLFANLADIIKVKRPQYLLLENVIALERYKDYYRFIGQTLTDLGYHFHVYKMSPHQLGVPQIRRRIFIWASLDPFYEVLFPIRSIDNPMCPPGLRPYIDWDLPEDQVSFTDNYAWDKAMKSIVVADKLDPMQVFFEKDWGSVYYYKSLDRDAAKTLVTCQAEFPIVYHRATGRWRFATPREGARLQSIPETFELPKTKTLGYKAIGNTINVDIAAHILDFHLNGRIDSDFFKIQTLLF